MSKRIRPFGVGVALLVLAVATAAGQEYDCLACGKDAKCVKSVIQGIGGAICTRTCTSVSSGGELKELCLCTTSGLECPKDVPGGGGGDGIQRGPAPAEYAIKSDLFGGVPEWGEVLRLFAGGQLVEGTYDGKLADSSSGRTFAFKADVTVAGEEASLSMTFREHPDLRMLAASVWDADGGQAGFVVVETRRGSESFAVEGQR